MYNNKIIYIYIYLYYCIYIYMTVNNEKTINDD